jgi:glutaredoxin-like protein
VTGEVTDTERLIVYWRRMCGFCTRLMGALEEAGIEVEYRDIWEDPEAAAFVRSVNDGAETVPTVVLPDGRTVTNPPPEALIAHLADS